MNNLFTIGIEEEFMIIDPETRELVSHMHEVVEGGKTILNEQVKAEMAQMKSEHEALLVQAREERAQMLKEARETKEKIINESKETAKTEASKIVSEAMAAIEAQKMAAITDVKNQVGKMVIEVSEKILRRELGNKADQEAHIKGLVNDVKLN